MSRKVLTARGRKELLPVGVTTEDGNIFAKPLRKGSGAITSLAKADGYIEVSLNREILKENEIVRVKLFEGENFG